MGRGSRVWRCSGPPLPAPTSHSGTLKLARHGSASVTGPWLPCQTFPVHALLPSKPLSPRPAPPRGSLDLSTLAPLTPVSWLFSRSKGCRCLVLHLECPLGQSPCLRSLSAAQCLHHSGLPGRLKAGETRKRLETLQSSQVSVGLGGRSLSPAYQEPPDGEQGPQTAPAPFCASSAFAAVLLAAHPEPPEDSSAADTLASCAVDMQGGAPHVSSVLYIC